jgi:hypothetical protein
VRGCSGDTKAKLPKIRLHDLRHTFGTIAVQAFPLSDVKAYMGHADIATTMLYVHHVPQDDAADRLTAVFRQAERPDLPPVSGHGRDTVGEEEGRRRTKTARLRDFRYGPGRTRTFDQRIMSPLL